MLDTVALSCANCIIFYILVAVILIQIQSAYYEQRDIPHIAETYAILKPLAGVPFRPFNFAYILNCDFLEMSSYYPLSLLQAAVDHIDHILARVRIPVRARLCHHLRDLQLVYILRPFHEGHEETLR
jgi:hypothetical protein